MLLKILLKDIDLFVALLYAEVRLFNKDFILARP
jgi:hypothetical protein